MDTQKGWGESVRFLREQFPDLTIIAGNVTTASGVSLPLLTVVRTV